MKKIIAIVLLVVLALSTFGYAEETPVGLGSVNFKFKAIDCATGNVIASDSCSIGLSATLKALLDMDVNKIRDSVLFPYAAAVKEKDMMKKAEKLGYDQVSDVYISVDWAWEIDIDLTFKIYYAKKPEIHLAENDNNVNVFQLTYRDAETKALIASASYDTTYVGYDNFWGMNDARYQMLMAQIEIQREYDLKVVDTEFEYTQVKAAKANNYTNTYVGHVTVYTTAKAEGDNSRDLPFNPEQPEEKTETATVVINFFEANGAVRHWGFDEGEVNQVADTKYVEAEVGSWFSTGDIVVPAGYSISYINNVGKTGIGFEIHEGNNFVNVYLK